MEEYLNLVREVLEKGEYKPNRTSMDTISHFGSHYKIDLQEGFPLLTTKDLSGFRWNSLLHEFFWYLSGEEHIRTLSDKTGIWDAWADENGNLDTAYGRFWRRYPIPSENVDQLQGESWVVTENGINQGRWEDTENIDVSEWVSKEHTKNGETRYTFDQFQYVLDMLTENPNSRRIIINAWHPANATISTLPPCHYTFIFSVQNGKLNTHLTQRSGDVALGIPFNIAAYSLLTHILAQEAGLEVGEFSHTIVDAHIYCGTGERGNWYGENLTQLQENIFTNMTESDTSYENIRKQIETNAPPVSDDGEDHIPALLQQLSRTPYDRPSIKIADKPLTDLEYEDIQLIDYQSHSDLSFKVAE